MPGRGVLTVLKGKYLEAQERYSEGYRAMGLSPSALKGKILVEKLRTQLEQDIQPLSGLVAMEEDSKGPGVRLGALISFGDECQFSSSTEFVSFGRC